MNRPELPIGVRDDKPAWEQPEPIQEKRTPYGFCDVLTWQSRRIVLLPETVDDVVVVKRVIVSGGFDLITGTEHLYQDPMFYYKQSEGKRGSGVKFDPNRAGWRELLPLLSWVAEAHDGERLTSPDALNQWYQWCADHPSRLPRLTIECLGVANDKSKMELWRHERLSIPAHLLAQSAVTETIAYCLGTANIGRSVMAQAIFTYCEQLMQRAGTRDILRSDVTGASQSMGWEHSFWGELETEFTQWVIVPIALQTGNTVDEIELQNLRLRWLERMRLYVIRQFDKHTQTSGAATHQLRAHVIARGTLFRALKKQGLEAYAEEGV